MKNLLPLLLLALCPFFAASQGSGWSKVTDPTNEIALYTTNYPYAGAAFVDINGDDLPDIFASPKRLFVNLGGGKFSETAPLNFSEQSAAAGSSWADLDNDGDQDCLIAASPSRLFLNNGMGTFSNGTAQVPGLTSYNSWACALGDFNLDNRLDLMFAHAAGFHPGVPAPCKLYKQSDASFGFSAISSYQFLIQTNTYTNPFWSDYDLDGDMDLFIASGPVTMPGLDPCYKNLKKETGVDSLAAMTSELFATQNQDGQCYNFIDYDNDGDFDCCLTNYFNVPSRLYRNDGGTFSLAPAPFSVTATTNLANCWGDYDNDGDLDVVITNDNAQTRYYRNNGDGTFIYLSNGFKTPTATCGIANGDCDNDGDLDLFVNGVGNNGNTSSVGLYLNQTVAANRHWVNFKLTGTTSNRSAIGAIVRIRAVIGGSAVWQIRELNAQNSFQGQNDLRVHFGLNDATAIDSLVVRWPSGLEQNFGTLPADQFYKLTEGDALPTVGTDNPQVGAGVAIFPNPLEKGAALHLRSTENMFRLRVFDSSGRAVFQQNFGKTGIREIELTDPDFGGATGVFWIELTFKEGQVVRKVLRL